MSLFEQLGQQAQMTNPMQMLSRLRSDPSGVLKQMGLSIPAGMNDPRQIIQHLVQSGQIPQARYNQALNMLGRR